MASLTPSADRIIDVARGEVGYHEGRDPNGNWNNYQKYSPAVPGLEWSQNQAWCATFVSWCAMTAGLSDLYPRTASTDLGASWFKKAGRWSEYPAIGAQVFYGHNGDMNHTGLVVGYDSIYVYTVEGNTNTSGSAQGDGVYKQKRRRRDDYVQGYGYPAFPEGIVSADPAWADRAPKPKPVGPKITVAEQSGLWDAPLESWTTALANATAIASVVGLTETTKDTIKSALPAGHALVRFEEPGQNENSIVFSEEVWELTGEPFAYQTAGTQFYTANGKLRPPTHATVAALRHKATGKVYIFLVVHQPASVEGAEKLDGPLRRVTAYVESKRGIRRAMKTAYKKYGKAPVIAMGDFNLNYRRPWVQRFFKSTWPGLRCTWKKLPAKGTHGGRVIDYIFATRQFAVLDGGAVLLPRVDGFDHTGLFVGLQSVE